MLSSPQFGAGKAGQALDPDSVETWIFDLDNTLYPASCDLFSQVDRRMCAFIQDLLDLVVVLSPPVDLVPDRVRYRLPRLPRHTPVLVDFLLKPRRVCEKWTHSTVPSIPGEDRMGSERG